MPSRPPNSTDEEEEQPLKNTAKTSRLHNEGISSGNIVKGKRKAKPTKKQESNERDDGERLKTQLEKAKKLLRKYKTAAEQTGGDGSEEGDSDGSLEEEEETYKSPFFSKGVVSVEQPKQKRPALPKLSAATSKPSGISPPQVATTSSTTDKSTRERSMQEYTTSSASQQELRPEPRQKDLPQQSCSRSHSLSRSRSRPHSRSRPRSSSHSRPHSRSRSRPRSRSHRRRSRSRVSRRVSSSSSHPPSESQASLPPPSPSLPATSRLPSPDLEDISFSRRQTEHQRSRDMPRYHRPSSSRSRIWDDSGVWSDLDPLHDQHDRRSRSRDRLHAQHSQPHQHLSRSTQLPRSKSPARKRRRSRSPSPEPQPILYRDDKIAPPPSNVMPKASDYSKTIEELINRAVQKLTVKLYTVDAFPSDELVKEWSQECWIVTCRAARKKFAPQEGNARIIIAVRHLICLS
ncbi:uncharacterized protein PHACADRAFT_189288 [Phanerochaete carnosa HHB-10118-sp]|uniref:Uncharacterized protein n=1 Tax=Phanerochaete carnosa (strain HHB-10118-sp) TaxID=650164 RepID=K5VA79_PHACS|nr:uncharacterized protein PHACADRAFT_189288 [Phanerochaete carnosa HHB-10118-sp]EKM47988.1 hypothetical protein PHACADRAFT_189288 [Phanerochaete carnosa HHB-10118-sp]